MADNSLYWLMTITVLKIWPFSLSIFVSSVRFNFLSFVTPLQFPAICSCEKVEKDIQWDRYLRYVLPTINKENKQGGERLRSEKLEDSKNFIFFFNVFLFFWYHLDADNNYARQIKGQKQFMLTDFKESEGKM